MIGWLTAVAVFIGTFAMFAIPIAWYHLMLKLYQWNERRKRYSTFHRG